jgi:hypothetical protein
MFLKALNYIKGGIFLLLSLILINPASLSAGPNVLDLNALQTLGVTEDTLELIVRSSLSPRARAPMDADFLYALASYGGEPLTRSYLELDMSYSHEPRAPISQADITSMMRNRVAVDQMIAAIDAALYGTDENEDDLYSAPSAGESEIMVSDIPSDYNNVGPVLAAGAVGTAPAVGAALGSSGGGTGAAGGGSVAGGAAAASSLPSVPMSEISPQYTTAVNSSPFERTQMESDAFEVTNYDPGSPLSSGVAPSPNYGEAARPPAPSMDPFLGGENLPIFSTERAGSGFANGAPHPLIDLKTLPAPPARESENSSSQEAQSPAPEELVAGATATPYPVREPDQSHTFFMGSYETETLDGHRVDVHRNSRSGFLGTSVESTASGKKVHRAFSGKTESAVDGARGSDASKKKRSPLGGTPAELSDFLP